MRSKLPAKSVRSLLIQQEEEKQQDHAVVSSSSLSLLSSLALSLRRLLLSFRFMTSASQRSPPSQRLSSARDRVRESRSKWRRTTERKKGSFSVWESTMARRSFRLVLSLVLSVVISSLLALMKRTHCSGDSSFRWTNQTPLFRHIPPLR